MAKHGASVGKPASAKGGFSAATEAALKEQAAALRAAGMAQRSPAAMAVARHADATKAHERSLAMREVATTARTAALVRNLGGGGWGWAGPPDGGGSGPGGATTNGEGRPWILLTPALQLALLRAVQHGVTIFTALAYFRHVAVNGPIATGHPGCLTGPDIAVHVSAEPYQGEERPHACPMDCFDEG